MSFKDQMNAEFTEAKIARRDKERQVTASNLEKGVVQTQDQDHKFHKDKAPSPRMIAKRKQNAETEFILEMTKLLKKDGGFDPLED